VSRLNDLLRQLRMENSALADDLQREFDALADRRSFGLNFERHVPEAVELPGRKVRKGDKVRILPTRGEARTAADDRLWRVTSIVQDDGVRRAALASLDDADEDVLAAIADLVVVAEFRDPIYPGLVSTGKVERGDDKPFHTVINGENFHALQTLLFTHRGKVDCIYIDPPYNTGAKDWKYNNDYVESDDHYRHSKWLAFIERRLLLAKELLNPDDSVLVVTIDEKEYLRLGLLLEQTFSGAGVQMVSTVINPTGVNRPRELSRVNEYVFIVAVGLAAPGRVGRTWAETGQSEGSELVAPYWRNLRRSGSNSLRSDRPNLYYSIYLSEDGERFAGFGGVQPANSIEVLPTRPDGLDGYWQLSPPQAEAVAARGLIRIRAHGGAPVIQYLARGEQAKVEAGLLQSTGQEPSGAHVLVGTGADLVAATNQWAIPSHSARHHGAALLGRLLPGRTFPFPKSLYAVEDVLRLFVLSRPDAVVLDFFAGSGTTAHAVMRLNKQDGGHRQSISVTNNEVSADEQRNLRESGLRPGDADWEAVGVCDHITRPRIEAAVTGCTPDGKPIAGDYKFTDEFPMADGLAENVEFFSLSYEAPLRVASNREFLRVAPVLWMRAGSRGRRIDEISGGWDVAEVYGVIADLDQSDLFLKAIATHDDVAMAFVVTDEDRLFESLVAQLPDHVEPVRLYEAYLRNFEIEAGRGAR
jgi:adenine-specific DNA-methyltransferase